MIVCPTNLVGSPVLPILSATTISLLKNSAEDGFGKYYINNYKAADTRLTIGISITF